MGRKVSTGTFELEKDRERERLKNVKLGEEVLNKDVPDIKNSAKSPTKFIKIVIQAKPAERIDQEEASSSPEPDADPGHNGEHTNGAENTKNHEDEDDQSGPGFGNQEFVHSKPQGISFGLHEPTKVKPQPKEAPVPAADPDPDTDSADARGRAAAASFFAAHSGGEAAVPLPPSTSFMEDSEDEEEEGPPGLGSVELPPEIFKKVKNTGNQDIRKNVNECPCLGSDRFF